MPNYTHNVLEVRGEVNRLRKFIDRHIVDGYFDFNTIIPQPKYKSEAGSKYFFNSPAEAEKQGILWDGKPELFDWYHWRIDKWGTKWNADGLFNKQSITPECIKGEGRQVVHIVFETAWHPPIPIVEQLIRWYHKNLTIVLDYYSFENMDAGSVWYNSYNKEIVHDYYKLK